MNLEKVCLGFECDKAKNCRQYVKQRHPHDVFFMPAEKGSRCHSYEPLRSEDHDND